MGHKSKRKKKMPKSINSSVISFGMVSIPVKMFSTGNSSASISFKQLGPDGQALKQLYVDANAYSDNKKRAKEILEDIRDGGDFDEDELSDVLDAYLHRDVVARKDMLKGYEYAKGKYVKFQQSEVKKLQEVQDHAIAISEFVPVGSVPEIYQAKSYYLSPNTGGDKAYRLLAKAMEETGQRAIARYVSRGKQYLVMLAPMDDGLVMHQLHYEDEVTDFALIEKGNAEVSEPELNMAKQLITSIQSECFDPSKYEDDVKTRLRDAIETRLAGEEIEMPSEDAPRADTQDLMAALQASIPDAA